ncbi:MAG: hypothetical protein WC117_00340 [Sphaerochaetaceae bacterium]
MIVQLKKVKFVFHFNDGSTKELIKDLPEGDGLIEWIAQQYADVNSCGIEVFIDGKSVVVVTSPSSTI